VSSGRGDGAVRAEFAYGQLPAREQNNQNFLSRGNDNWIAGASIN
jgi:hypothetical protein